MLTDLESRGTPVVMLSNDDELYARYRPRVASRVKRGFRKSTLLSGIQYALHQGVDEEHSLGNGILCVDDDAEILTFMARCLENEGHTVARCGTGEEALEQLATKEFGLVLLDIAMPKMDGWETCRRIRLDQSLDGIKICMVTAKPVDPNMSRNRATAVDGYLTKPFKAEDLIELVRSYGRLRGNSDA